VNETAVRFWRGKSSFIFKIREPSGDQPLTGEAAASDDGGDVVGVKGSRGFFRRSSGADIEIIPLSNRPDRNGSRATALNDAGTVVGATTVDVRVVHSIQSGVQYSASGAPEPIVAPDPNDYFVHAFIATFPDGKQQTRDLGPLFGYPNTVATGVNESNVVVGYSGTQPKPELAEVSGPSAAWMWRNGVMTQLPFLRPGDSAFAYGVNSRNVVVGCSGARAVRWLGSRVEALDRLIGDPHGWTLNCARAINRSGWIVGDGTRKGRPAMFLLVPRYVPS
jgi:uncharacterized membrane protein